ncbi:hypothetical protein ACRARG_02235 [Pseudooceanicola sp. C21-150M6]|uniref:hypothetical protein n=1 Tax=Pseudooceanicola sp. C21-150M6 TaxID=3434355 RepID=UPI003D7F3A39
MTATRNSPQAIANRMSQGRFKKARTRPIPEENLFIPGDVLPAEVMILINPLRYGLPLPHGGWTYFKSGQQIYRADMQSRQVLDHMNPHLSRY